MLKGYERSAMKLLIIRHGDPDCENNCLTERQEAEVKAYCEGCRLRK
ncbi:MAG TPA: hypothetical protein GXX37_04305 [Clostridiaceae bacterium]|nr:hypothetical protein [Clostridiaceae bacterium]